jgi:hypothetical protein
VHGEEVVAGRHLTAPLALDQHVRAGLGQLGTGSLPAPDHLPAAWS